MHRQCLNCGHIWFEDVREAIANSRAVEDSREADAELGALVRRMSRSGMALYRTENLNWSVRVWDKRKNLWISLATSGDSPEDVMREAIAEMEELENEQSPQGV
jgi:hypothetical protein